MTNPEEHNLKGWLTELVELTSAVKCNDLFDALLVDHSRAEFERRSRRIQAIAAHVRSYGIDDEMWEMAVREQDHVDSEEAVSAHAHTISPVYEQAESMRNLQDVLAITHFRMKLRLAILQDEESLRSSRAISTAHDTQPTRLGDTVVIHKVVSDDTDENEMRRAV